MNPVEKASINALAEAMKSAEKYTPEASETISDFVSALLAEPDKKRRKAMMKEFSSRRNDVAKFLKDNEELINAEAEMALIKSAVGGKDGKKKIPPNSNSLKFLLKNRMPDKYSDKPAPDVEIEDVSEIEEDLYGDSSKKDDTV